MLCVAAFRPRVAEVDENALDLVGSKHLAQFQCVHRYKPHVVCLFGAGALHGDDHSILDPFKGDKLRLGIFLCRADRKLALAAAYLEPQAFSGKALTPFPAQGGRLGYLHRGALFHARLQIRFFLIRILRSLSEALSIVKYHTFDKHQSENHSISTHFRQKPDIF